VADRAVLPLLAVLGLALVALGSFTLEPYLLDVLTRSFIYAILAVTVDLLWGYTGILTFGQSAFFGLGVYATAMILTYAGTEPWLVALAATASVVLAAVLGWLVGFLSFFPASSPLYASVISLVLPVVATQLVYSGGEITGSSSGLVGFETLDVPLEGWFAIAGVTLVAVITGAAVVVRSEAGRLLRAIRDNEMRCAYLGIDVSRVRTLLLAATAAVAGGAGFLYTEIQSVAAPENTGLAFGTELVVWVALGGRATLLGPALAAIGVELLSSLLSGDLPFVWQLLVGTLFVAVILYFPRGLGPALAGPLLRRAGRWSAAAPTIRTAPPLPHHAGADPALRVQALGRHYGALQVLSGLDLTGRDGEIIGIIGPNGAGKTTLMRCLSDGGERTHGTVAIGPVTLQREPPHRCTRLGIGRKFQTASAFDTLSVAECLRIARARLDRPSLVRPIRTIDLPAAAIAVLRATGLDRRLNEPAGRLSHGLKQALELAMVFALEPRVVLLDEPTAGLTKAERQALGAVFVAVAAEAGPCLLLVEHDLDFVQSIASRVVVLHQGRVLLDGSPAEIAGSDLVRSVYAGQVHA
jgi:branched-chain amino acid transport system permease protein